MKHINIKKVVIICIASIMTISMVSCSSKSEETDAYDSIISSGKLVVGLSADYAPFEYHAIIDGEDEIVGIDVELAQAIADELGVELEIVDMEFSALCEAVKSGKVDLAISGMTPSDERDEVVDFSEIYYDSAQTFIINSKDEGVITSLEDLSGKTVGAQLGSVQEEIAESIDGADVELLSDVDTLILELKNGNIDALICETPIASLASEENDEISESGVSIETDEDEGSAVAMPENSPKLLEAVNNCIETLKEEGKIDEFVQNAVEEAQYQVTE